MLALLLRAVNLPGRNKVGMAALADLCAGLGCTSVKTLLQSGNAVFEAPPGAGIEKKFSRAFAKRFGFAPEFFLRTGAELRRTLDANPFPDVALEDPSHLLLHFVDGKPGALDWSGPERVAAGKRVVYIHYAEGIGRSKLTTAVLDRALGMRGTARNWNTVRKLAELCAP